VILWAMIGPLPAVLDGVDAPQRPWCATVEVLRSTT
jgi:hypothetical protein